MNILRKIEKQLNEPMAGFDYHNGVDNCSTCRWLNANLIQCDRNNHIDGDVIIHLYIKDIKHTWCHCHSKKTAELAQP